MQRHQQETAEVEKFKKERAAEGKPVEIQDIVQEPELAGITDNGVPAEIIEGLQQDVNVCCGNPADPRGASKK
jgi:hypothetical protein